MFPITNWGLFISLLHPNNDCLPFCLRNYWKMAAIWKSCEYKSNMMIRSVSIRSHLNFILCFGANKRDRTWNASLYIYMLYWSLTMVSNFNNCPGRGEWIWSSESQQSRPFFGIWCRKSFSVLKTAGLAWNDSYFRITWLKLVRNFGSSVSSVTSHELLVD